MTLQIITKHGTRWKNHCEVDYITAFSSSNQTSHK